MEILLLLILIVLVAILLTRQSGTRNALLHKIDDLSSQLDRLQYKLKDIEIRSKAELPNENKPVEIPKEKPVEETRKNQPIVESLITPPSSPVALGELDEKVLEQKRVAAAQKRTYLEEVQERMNKPAVAPPQPTESWWDKWVRNNPDIEKFIGENLANKIGIAVLVLGIAFFVKYAIDKDWIKEGGRIAIGFGCGAILVGVAHYLRNSYRSFSSVLVGGGLCVFYFTVAFAFQEYGMMSQTIAFGAMVIITAFVVALSLLYNRLELAVLATIGGFITPFLVSTGNANYVALFTYFTILNVGLLVLSYFKKWPAINIIALFFTVVIYGSWLGLYNGEPGFSNKTAFAFATIFYLLFVATNTLNNLREKRIFTAFDFSILLSINALFYAAGIIILKDVNGGAYKGLFTTALGVLNLGMAYFLFRNQRVDKNFIYLLIGLTLTYISLAAPVQLSGNNITLFWAAECVVLYWLYSRSTIALLKVAALIVSGLAFASLLMDIDKTYNGAAVLPIVFNRAFITTIVTAIAYSLIYWQIKKSKEVNYFTGITNRFVTTVLLVVFTGLLYAAGALEIRYQFKMRVLDYDIAFVYLQLYTFCFALGILLLLLQRFDKNTMAVRNIILIVCFAMYLYYFFPITNAFETALLQGNHISFAGHWLADIAFLALLFFEIKYVRKNRLALEGFLPVFTWFACCAAVFFLSVEVGYLFTGIAYQGTLESLQKAQTMYAKAGVTITWAVASFLFMWLGMQHRYKTLRVVSLSLFTVALLKLFLWDIRNISEGGKIAAFIMLGILLLIISFMYQRLKKLFANDEAMEK